MERMVLPFGFSVFLNVGRETPWSSTLSCETPKWCLKGLLFTSRRTCWCHMKRRTKITYLPDMGFLFDNVHMCVCSRVCPWAESREVLPSPSVFEVRGLHPFPS